MVLLLVNNLFKLAKNLGLKQEILVHKNSFNVKWRPSDSLCCKQKSMNLFWFYYNHDCSILILLLPIKNAFSKRNIIWDESVSIPAVVTTTTTKNSTVFKDLESDVPGTRFYLKRRRKKISNAQFLFFTSEWTEMNSDK